MLPLSLRIKRETHSKIASAQDDILEEVYQKFPQAVLHGGTAIWRCYHGKRFSEDLDFYLPHDKKAAEELFSSLEHKGFKVIKQKISPTSIYSELEKERVAVRLEATYQKVKRNLQEYETVDGRKISIYTLTPEEFIIEKVATYLKRFKIRDLYDIFFLLKDVSHLELIKTELSQLIHSYKPPVDSADLKAIILDGLVPSAEEMLNYIKRKWESANTSSM